MPPGHLVSNERQYTAHNSSDYYSIERAGSNPESEGRWHVRSFQQYRQADGRLMSCTKEGRN